MSQPNVPDRLEVTSSESPAADISFEDEFEGEASTFPLYLDPQFAARALCASSTTPCCYDEEEE